MFEDEITSLNGAGARATPPLLYWSLNSITFSCSPLPPLSIFHVAAADGPTGAAVFLPPQIGTFPPNLPLPPLLGEGAGETFFIYSVIPSRHSRGPRIRTLSCFLTVCCL